MLKKDLKQGEIFEISISGSSRGRVLRQVRKALAEKKSHRPIFIVTPNAEIILLTRADKKLAEALAVADIRLADGIGVIMAVKFLAQQFRNDPFRPLKVFFFGLWVGFSVLLKRDWLFREGGVVKGRELFLDLITLANKRGYRVFLLGGQGEEARETKEILVRNFKKVRIKENKGPMVDQRGFPASLRDSKIEKDIVSEITRFKPHFLFVAFGAPKQEKWVARYLNHLPVKLVMTVGGTFNYVSGQSKLPPDFLSKQGLEWLWRFVKEPRRLTRVVRAVIVFPCQVFVYKLKN